MSIFWHFPKNTSYEILHGGNKSDLGRKCAVAGVCYWLLWVMDEWINLLHPSMKLAADARRHLYPASRSPPPPPTPDAPSVRSSFTSLQEQHDGLSTHYNAGRPFLRVGSLLRLHGNHQTDSEAEQRRLQWNGEYPFIGYGCGSGPLFCWIQAPDPLGLE